MAERLMTKEVFKGFVEGYYKPDLEKRDEALETAKTETKTELEKLGKSLETTDNEIKMELKIKASIGETVGTATIEVG